MSFLGSRKKTHPACTPEILRSKQPVLCMNWFSPERNHPKMRLRVPHMVLATAIHGGAHVGKWEVWG